MSTDSGERVCDSRWLEEYDCVPLRLRLKMLHSIENVNAEAIITKDSELPTRQAPDSGTTSLSSDNSSSGHSVDCLRDSDLGRKLENSSICSSKMPVSEARTETAQCNNPVGFYLHQTTSDSPSNVLQDCFMDSRSANVQANDIKHDNVYEFDDALDNVVLRERRNLLLSRWKLMLSVRSDMGQDIEGLSNLSKIMLQSAESDSMRDTLIAENLKTEVNCFDNQALENATEGTSHTDDKHSPPLPISAAVPPKSRSLPLFAECESISTQDGSKMKAPALASSFMQSLASVKDEPLDVNELFSERKDIMQNSFIGPTLTVKSEPGFSEYLLDELDHMPLVERIKLLPSGIPSFDLSENTDFSKEDVASALDHGTDVLESVKPLSISRPRKKRRTATDSVETALEEDAPGLLKVLLERGVSPEEIKLYGEEDSDDALDDSFSEDGFTELEAIISQLFSQRQTFLKFPLLRTKGVKISYCLSCLLSLVEQTRYLRNRKWPVEWGWCRDLQSFVFVFQRHNRIVLERPEYGYATYFFELLNSVPVAWQIKRLVTAMKLTSCGRITVIENKPLVVGEDLNEAEARILAEYGWTPNTGLGTMLNYCDRVVHDRKQELDSSEWRSKIGRQLMNGYNGGNLVVKHLPKRLADYQESQNVQVKMED
ncbi:hypothetical protein BVRB_2g039220 isoform B [Beta vulgaris subsp. vulgaris]|nr:hypothetical protein BVRB_2g039220 isoform B [Beta vulgaris subsp. vulgaris]